MPLMQYKAVLETPIGVLRVTAVERGVTDITFLDAMVEPSSESLECLEQCVLQLREYFEGKRTAFDSLQLAVRGTDFQQQVWDIASDIPYGGTSTYGAIAEKIGMNGGGQAVGSALGRNPLCIVVPCHRIVPRTPEGTIGGYAGGAWRKEWLLRHEGSLSR
jgi:methylated-DNA-[protein]-cysteine S-methyltransferase